MTASQPGNAFIDKHCSASFQLSILRRAKIVFSKDVAGDQIHKTTVQLCGASMDTNNSAASRGMQLVCICV